MMIIDKSCFVETSALCWNQHTQEPKLGQSMRFKAIPRRSITILVYSSEENLLVSNVLQANSSINATGGKVWLQVLRTLTLTPHHGNSERWHYLKSGLRKRVLLHRKLRIQNKSDIKRKARM